MQTDLILTREIHQLPEPAARGEHFTARQIHDSSDAASHTLDRFYTAEGFPDQWTAQLLKNGAQAVMICHDELPVAAGWLIRKPFYIEEIRRTFDPGPTSDYYFGDFVAPAFRGKRLQRALIRERLRLTHQAGYRWATAITRSTLPASLSSYSSEGFSVAVALCKRVCLGMEWTRVCRVDRTRYCGQLSKEGLRLPFSSYLRLAR